jgi:Cu/Zn superoxide dismutase
VAESKGKRRWNAAGLALATMLILAACSNNPVNAPGPAENPEKKKSLRGLEAHLIAKGGSSARGKVTINQKGDRWQLSITAFSLPPGLAYRVAFFDNGNCSSPNAFSAGKLWLPPGSPEGTRPDVWIPSLYTDTLGNADVVMRLPNPVGHDEEVFRKRSVLIFFGNTAQELKPGVPNEVVACGVFDTIQTLF